MTTGSTSGVVTFARRVGGTLGVRLAITGTGVLSGIILARWLGSGAVGIIASLNVMVLVAITFGNLGLPSSITFIVAGDRTKARKVLRSAVPFGFAIGVLLAAVIAFTVWLRPTLMGEVPFELVAIGCVALPFQMVSYLCLAIYLGLERIRTYNLVDLTMQSMTLVGAVFLIVALGKGVREFVIFAAAANVLIGIAVALTTYRATSRSGENAEPVMRPILRYGLRFFVALLAGTLILRGDLLLVNYFRTPEEAGVYAVATQASIFLHMMPNVISTILFPRTSAKKDESGDVTCRVTRHSVALLGLLCLAAIPCAFLLPLLYGKAFADAPALFLILLPGVFLLGIETIQVQHFTGLGLPRLIPVYWVITTAFVVILDVLFIPKYGAYAAAVVSTLAYALIFVLVARLFSSSTSRSFSEAFILRSDEISRILDLSVFRRAEDEA